MRASSSSSMNFCRVMSTLALRYRSHIALVNVERNRRYTFPEYHRLTNRIANMMREGLGLGRDDRVLLILDNDNLSLLHFPTIFKQEAAVCFSNLRDSRSEHFAQVNLITPKVVFIESKLAVAYHDELSIRGCRIVAMDPAPDLPAGTSCFWDLVEAASEQDNSVELNVHEHVTILRFTGGTTGRGKCAMYAPDHFFACRDSFYAQPDACWNESVRYLASTPISHASQMPFLAAFFAGATTLTMNGPDLIAWSETVQAERITHALLVPTLLYRLVEMRCPERYDLSSLRSIMYGASPMAPSALEGLIAQFGSIFTQAYGATETIMLVSALNTHDHDVSSETKRKRLSSAGRVTPGVELVIADENGMLLPVGKTGEIRMRARGTISGYYNNPEGTAAEFVNGFWLSGDLGYLDEDGYLFIVDRKKDMIITGGFNVYAVEVEAALSDHPCVLMSAVVGIPHPDWGEAVHAEVILCEGATVTERALADHVKAKLGSYKAPKTIVFVSELPLSPVGKILRRKVRERYWLGQERRV